MKKIGGAVYVHWTAYRELSKEQQSLVKKAAKICPIGFDKSEVYKVDLKNKKVSFIECKDFDTAREPEVGRSWCVNIETKEIKEIKAKGQIYHHKWMFVKNDYDGFDIEESKTWSQLWENTLPKDRAVKSRIGYKKYWNEYLELYGLA